MKATPTILPSIHSAGTPWMLVQTEILLVSLKLFFLYQTKIFFLRFFFLFCFQDISGVHRSGITFQTVHTTCTGWHSICSVFKESVWSVLVEQTCTIKYQRPWKNPDLVTVAILLADTRCQTWNASVEASALPDALNRHLIAILYYLSL